MADIPEAGYFSNGSLTQGNSKTALEALVASLRHVPWSGQTELSNTIVSGAITPAGSGGVTVVETEALATTDDLTTINTGNYPNGAFLLLRNANANRSVVVKHAVSGVATIQLDRGVDCVLDDTKKWLLLRRHDANWYELIRGPQRVTTEVVTNSAAFTVQKQNFGSVFVCTGAYTVSLAAAANLGAGFLFGVMNVGTSTIVIDPNSSELVDGASTMSIPQGWSFEFVCTGTGWATIASHGPNIPTLNLLINGSCEVWQRATTFSAGPSSGSFNYLADRWTIQGFGTGAAQTYNRSTNVPTVAQAGLVLNYSLEVDCANAVVSPAAGDVSVLRLAISGGAWRHLRKRQLTLSFWVMSPKTGAHAVVLNESVSWSYVAPYTVTAANTWEYKSVTLTPSIGNVGTGDTVTTLCHVSFPLYCGTTYQTGGASAWAVGQFFGATGQVNLMDNTANFFRVTGVKIESGSIATPYDVGSFELEYLRCLAYYQKSFSYDTAVAPNAGANTGEFIFTQTVGASTVLDGATIPFIVPHVAAGGGVLYNPQSGDSNVYNRNTSTSCSSTAITHFGTHHFAIKTTTPGGSAVNQTLAIHWAIGL